MSTTKTSSNGTPYTLAPHWAGRGAGRRPVYDLTIGGHVYMVCQDDRRKWGAEALDHDDIPVAAQIAAQDAAPGVVDRDWPSRRALIEAFATALVPAPSPAADYPVAQIEARLAGYYLRGWRAGVEGKSASGIDYADLNDCAWFAGHAAARKAIADARAGASYYAAAFASSPAMRQARENAAAKR